MKSVSVENRPSRIKTILLITVVVSIGVVATTVWQKQEIASYIPTSQKNTRSLTCKAGFYPTSRSSKGTICAVCPVGHSCAGGFAGAQPCPAGTFQPNTGATTCQLAQSGHFVAQQGQSSQQKCDYGHFTSQPGCQTCGPARPGHFVDKLGATQETPCPSGTYQPQWGQAECIKYTLDENSKLAAEENHCCSEQRLFGDVVKRVEINEVGFIHNEALETVLNRIDSVASKIDEQKLTDTGVVDQLSRDEAIRFLSNRLGATRCSVVGLYDLIENADGAFYATQLEKQFITSAQLAIDNSNDAVEIVQRLNTLVDKYAVQGKGLVPARIRLAGSVGKRSAELWFGKRQKRGKWRDIIKADLNGASLGAGIGSAVGGPTGAAVGAVVGGAASSIAAWKK